MIYKVKKDDQEFEIDDTVFFDQQPKDFKKAFNELKQGDTAGFDNATVILLDTGRVIVTIKEKEK